MAAAFQKVMTAVLAGFPDITGLSGLSRNYADLQLSPNAQVYLPGSEGFTNATTRWSEASKPGFDVIVKPATEEDVQQTVTRCPQSRGESVLTG